MAKRGSNTPLTSLATDYRTVNDDRFAAVTRRRFMVGAAAGAAGLGLALRGGPTVLAAQKDVGTITLDAVIVTYMSHALGTNGTVKYSLKPNYSITIGLRSMVNPDIALRASVAPDGEGIGQGAWEFESQRSDGALTLYHDLRTDTVEGVIAQPPNAPDQTAFFGLFRPVLEIRGTGQNGLFRFTDAGGTFVSLAGDTDPIAAKETRDSWRRQYVSDPAALVEPRYLFVTETNSSYVNTVSAERKPPKGLTAQTSAQVIAQSGFQSDALKGAFAVGSNVEITYFARQDSRGPILDVNADLGASAHASRFYWDRIFRTFVII